MNQCYLIIIKRNLKFNEPPYTACPELDLGRPAWPVLSDSEESSGVRAST